MEQAFGWPFDPIDFERTIKLDPRLRDGRIGFCAVEERRALGYVDLMDLTSTIVNGKVEKLGAFTVSPPCLDRQERVSAPRC
jgi:hypothetical protein